MHMHIEIECLVPVTTKADNSFPPNSNYLCPFVVLEKTLKSPLDCKEIKPVNHKKKKNQPSICIGRTDAETETPIFWPPDVANSLEKTPMLWKIKGKRRREWQKMRCLDSITDSNGHECEQTPGDGEGQGGLACSSPWGRKELDTT